MKSSMIDEPRVLRALVECHAQTAPHAVAITGPGSPPVDYRQLFGQIVDIEKYLRSYGIGRGDRVATVVGNGPRAATVVLGIASSANCVPLNPQMPAREFAALLSGLPAKALVVDADLNTAAVEAANILGISIIEIQGLLQGCAGALRRDSADEVESLCQANAQLDSVALTLHTSGTTAKPKQVPLTHANLICSARNSAIALGLSPADRCLNVMPMFHIHALMALLSSIAAGASVVCANRADPDEFYSCLERYQPTWYTASPAIHQMIVGQIARHRETVKRGSLRFIRSSSSALPERLYRNLESAFNAPVIECYAMTEAAYQITANPLPPRRRKIGSVGIAAGPELAIMDENGRLLPPKQRGEVVIRGSNVMPGYEDDAGANRAAFTQGWFRTGDVGFLDDEGYLFLTGRSKEIINKGGEKISPREVEEVLLRHPDVAEAAVFAIFHPILGEDVAAAIVPEDPSAIKEAAIRNFVFDRLAQFKVPQKIRFVKSLPRNPSGKVQRSRLAEQLGFAAPGNSAVDGESSDFVAPRGADEKLLAELWGDALHRGRVSVRDNFFDLGGYSLLGIKLCQRISQAFGHEVNIRFLYEAPTVEQQARLLRTDSISNAAAGKSLVPVRTAGGLPPFFWVHGESSSSALTRYLSPDQPLYSLEHQGHDGRPAHYTEVETIAAHYLDEIQTVQNQGPYFIGGYSFGGLIAFEMARQLKRDKREVGALFLLDSQFPTVDVAENSAADTPNALDSIAASVGRLLREKKRTWWRIVVKRIGRQVISEVEKLWVLAKPLICGFCVRTGILLPPSLRSDYILRIYDRARQNYTPMAYQGAAVYFQSAERRGLHASKWAELMTAGMAIYNVPGAHLDLRQEPYVKNWAETLSAILGNAHKRTTPMRSRRMLTTPKVVPSAASSAGTVLFGDRLVEMLHES